MRAPRILATLVPVLLVIGCAAPGPSAAPSSLADPPAEPIEAPAQRDGVAVTLLVDRGRVANGGDVTATVSIRNVAPGVMVWRGGGCELEGQFAITPPDHAIGAPPIGHAWDGDKNAIKQLALADAYTIRTPLPPRFAHVDIPFGCPANLAYHELQPAEEVRATVVWVASTVAGSPIPAGDYVLSVAVPFVGRDIPDPIAGGEPDPAPLPIVAALVVSVEGDPGVPSPSEAMDAILGDPAFTAWLPNHARRTWNSVAFRYVDGAWTLQLRYEPGRMMSVRRDPGTGAVTMNEGDAPDPQP
jgi:hypothetical protein